MAATKKLKKKVITPAKKDGIVWVGKPTNKTATVTVFGIEFEQGNDIGFGKCRRRPQGLNRYAGDGYDRLWSFILVDDHYILWGRNPQDQYMDGGGILQAAQFDQTYEVVDEDA